MNGKPVCFVQVCDRDRGVAWYRDVVGLPLLRSDPFGDVFQLGDAAELRLTAVPEFAPGPHPALGWDVADLKGSMAALKAKGVDFEIYEGFGQDEECVWTAPDGSSRLAWFRDCAGNVLILSGRD